MSFREKMVGENLWNNQVKVAFIYVNVACINAKRVFLKEIQVVTR